MIVQSGSPLQISIVSIIESFLKRSRDNYRVSDETELIADLELAFQHLGSMIADFIMIFN